MNVECVLMKRMIFGCALACYALSLGLVAGTRADGAELLENGSLDLTIPYNPNPGNPTSFAPQPANWTVVGTKTVSGAYTDPLASEPWAGPAPTPETSEGSGDPYSSGTGCDGLDCGVFFKPFGGNLTTGDLATGHLRQTVLGIPGDTYILSGWVGAEPNYSGLIPGTQTRTELAIDFLGAGFVLLSSSVIDLHAAGLGAPNGEPFAYREYSVSGVAPVGTLFVRPRLSMIDAYSNPAGGGQALVADDFSLQQVPEPSALMLAGLCALAGSLLCRRG